MKTILSTLIFSILGLNIIFAQEKPNFDDPKVQDQFIATAVKKLDKREKYNGESLYYLPFSQVPYSGRSVTFRENGQLASAGTYKDGRKVGLWVGWYSSGTKSGERNFKDGKLVTENIWYENGQKESEITYKDGKFVTRNNWYENGQKKSELTYKDGTLWSVETWKMDGEKCFETDLKDGNGTHVVRNDEDGTELFRVPYINGVRGKFIYPK